MDFTWDPDKARSNVKDHDGVTFEEATAVFYDGNAIDVIDVVSDPFEIRNVVLGMGAKARLLVAVYALRNNGKEIRIISARKAVPQEATQYFEEL